jgi:carboxylate-amine ligase
LSIWPLYILKKAKKGRDIMDFQFQGKDKLTIGVEIELQLLDPETFDLIPKSEELLKRCRATGLDRVKAEIHQSMLEMASMEAAK